MQQDAHEFLNFLINHINEIIVAEQNQTTSKSGGKEAANGTSDNAYISNASLSSNGSCIGNKPGQAKSHTWVNDIFQGILTSETRCLNCETVTSKDEDFFDLSIDVEQNTSITSCLKNFSNTETLCSDNKFKCDSCSTYQEAHVRIFFTVEAKKKKKNPGNRDSNFEYFFFAETDEGQKSANHSCFAFEAVQIHGTVQQAHKGFSSSRLSPRTSPV